MSEKAGIKEGARWKGKLFLESRWSLFPWTSRFRWPFPRLRGRTEAHSLEPEPKVNYSDFLLTRGLYSGCWERKCRAKGQITSTRNWFALACSNAARANSVARPRPRSAGGTSVCQIVIHPDVSVSNSRYAVWPSSAISSRFGVRCERSLFTTAEYRGSVISVPAFGI